MPREVLSYPTFPLKPVLQASDPVYPLLWPQPILYPASLQGSLMPKFLTSALPGKQTSLRNHNKALGRTKKLTEPASLLEGAAVR